MILRIVLISELGVVLIPACSWSIISTARVHRGVTWPTEVLCHQNDIYCFLNLAVIHSSSCLRTLGHNDWPNGDFFLSKNHLTIAGEFFPEYFPMNNDHEIASRLRLLLNALLYNWLLLDIIGTFDSIVLHTRLGGFYVAVILSCHSPTPTSTTSPT